MSVESTAQQLINAGVEPGLAQVAAVDLVYGETGVTSEYIAAAYEQIQASGYFEQRSDEMQELFDRADAIGDGYLSDDDSDVWEHPGYEIIDA